MIGEPIEADAPDLRAALNVSHLPVYDLAEPGRCFFRFSENGDTVGFGGFEPHGESVLLRSIVVLPVARGMGRGIAVTEFLMQRAADTGARDAYLLTTDAAPFFERAGFQPVARETAPDAILATRQAASLCPSTATLLARKLESCLDA